MKHYDNQLDNKCDLIHSGNLFDGVALNLYHSDPRARAH